MSYFCEFKIKEIDGKRRYTFLTLQLLIREKEDLYIGTCTENTGNQLKMSDFMRNLSINPNQRFVWGCMPKDKLKKGEAIEKLRVEGQKPDGVIEYKSFDKTWYFWYYEDLESDKPGSQLEYTLGRKK